MVLTANFVSVDVTDKSQAVWYQDFPRRKSETCDFEVCIILRTPEYMVGRRPNIPFATHFPLSCVVRASIFVSPAEAYSSRSFRGQTKGMMAPCGR